MSRPNSILLVGAAHIDRYGRCDGPPVAGGSNPGRFAAMPGGAAFNVASSLAALGAGVRLCSILGDDAEARFIRDAAAARRVDLHAQVSAEHPTATYTSVVGPDGTLVIALADMAIYDALDPAEVQGVDAARWMLVDANPAPGAIATLLNGAARRRRTIAMTVSYAKAARLRPALSRIEILFTNRAELAALCGLDTEMPVEALLHRFGALGGRGAVVTDGAGDVWTVEDGTLQRHPVPPTTGIVDVTGAGDALTAGCLVALMAGRTLGGSVPSGIRAAQAVLAVHGPWRADLAMIAQP